VGSWWADAPALAAAGGKSRGTGVRNGLRGAIELLVDTQVPVRQVGGRNSWRSPTRFPRRSSSPSIQV